MEQLSFFDMTGEASPPPGAAAYAPLADRMRPRDLEDYIGQEHLLGKGMILRQMLEKDIVPSMIFWGPPGVGKTTLARIIAGRTRSGFVNFSAVTSGAKIDARNQLAEPVPLNIRNAPTSLMEELHYGEGYTYAHDTEEKIARMTCLPESLEDRRYYLPTEEGTEKVWKERLERSRAFRLGEP